MKLGMELSNIIARGAFWETPKMFTPRGTLPPSKKVKFFIYGAILLKFKTKHFHMFANNNSN